MKMKLPNSPISRRRFLGQAAAASALAGASPRLIAQSSSAKPSSFLDLLRFPDLATAYERLEEPLPLMRSGGEWTGRGITVATRVEGGQVGVTLSAPALRPRFLHLRWKMPIAGGLLALGDAWERSYGDLGWRNLIPEGVMPWYFATFDGTACHTYGVKTGAGALCFWQLDAEGVSLWLNTSNGGSGVQLGQRELLTATIVSREGLADEDAHAAIHAFCRLMCSRPSLRMEPIYGTNDWYYAYGKNTAGQILADTEFIAGLSAGNAVRPFSVIDGGWEEGSRAFPSMARVAEGIRDRKARPGIWIRPLLAPDGSGRNLLLPDARFGERKQRAKELAYDPTIAEAAAKIAATVKQVVDWRYELIKHDFSTYDLLGQWGFEMGAEPTVPGWSLHDPTRTNAEVLLDLYRLIRECCGRDALVLGCNTVGHLAQGLFDMSRTGDDTSGRVWERTRRMGINTLAFRLPQHGAFFIQDADCVGLTPAIPWEKNRQWLDLLARSGTALFVSPGEGSRTPEQANAIKQAFTLAASGQESAQPADWLEESTPSQWSPQTKSGAPSAAGKLSYDWCAPGGADPFPI